MQCRNSVLILFYIAGVVFLLSIHTGSSGFAYIPANLFGVDRFLSSRYRGWPPPLPLLPVPAHVQDHSPPGLLPLPLMRRLPPSPLIKDTVYDETIDDETVDHATVLPTVL
jgi:hypothetical protein